MSLKAKLLSRKGHPVDVQDWGETVYVRSMSEKEYVEYQKLVQDENATHTGLMLGVVATCMLDESGERVFGDDEIDQLSGLGLGGLNEVFRAVLKQTFPGDDPVDEAEGN